MPRYMHSGWPPGLDKELDRHVRRLERRMGRAFGAPSDPLLVSVRSGAKFSMPGMMDTILNLERTTRRCARWPRDR
ncbi:MAG: PEP/pyruvate-binding domain-containing protein [Acidimicrobiales bacterium]